MRAIDSISNRLIAGFVATLALVFCLLGVGWNMSVDYRRSIDRSYEDDLGGALQLANAMDALWKLRYGFPQYLGVGPEDRAHIVREQPALYAVIDNSLNDYRAGRRSPEELKQLVALRESYERYIGARPQWFDLMAAGRTKEAAEWRATKTTPLAQPPLRLSSAR